MDTQGIVTRFIVEDLARGSQQSIDPDASLIKAGILDSLALLKLIIFLEEQIGVKVSDREVIPANFDSVNRIMAFIEEKKVVSTT